MRRGGTPPGNPQIDGQPAWGYCIDQLQNIQAQVARQNSKLTELRASRDAHFLLLLTMLPDNPSLTDEQRRQNNELRKSALSLDRRIRRAETKQAELRDKHLGLTGALIVMAESGDNDIRRRHPGGRPPTFTWPDIWAEIVVRDRTKTFASFDELLKFVLDLTATRFLDPPSGTTVRRQLEPLKKKLSRPLGEGFEGRASHRPKKANLS